MKMCGSHLCDGVKLRSKVTFGVEEVLRVMATLLTPALEALVYVTSERLSLCDSPPSAVLSSKPIHGRPPQAVLL